MAVKRLGPGTKLLDCATYLGDLEGTFSAQPDEKNTEWCWNNNNERVEGALKFANSCDSVRQLTPVGVTVRSGWLGLPASAGSFAG